jgi:3-methylfumaryl-CoA hydratase
MFAGGRFTVRSPLRIGDRVTRCSELASTALKQGRSGEMLFVTVRHRSSHVSQRRHGNRARSPVYAGQPFAATGSPEGDLAIAAPGGVTAMTATFA